LEDCIELLLEADDPLRNESLTLFIFFCSEFLNKRTDFQVYHRRKIDGA